MPNEFATKPELAEEFPVVPVTWTDPITGLTVPKDPEKNLQWRAQLLEAAEEDPELQVDLYTAASQSLLFFINAFVFTLRMFEPDEETGEVRQAKNQDLPMVTWEIQDTHLSKVQEAIEGGQQLLTDKSRDMGATWNHLAVYVHRFLFRGAEQHLMISFRQDAVDQPAGLLKNYPFGPIGAPGTLFGKVDYILSRLPAWMLPNMTRQKLHLINQDTKGRLDGEATVGVAATGDRRTSIFLDEMAKMEDGETIKRTTRAVAASRLICSTPNGAGTAYSKWRMSGTIPVFILPWWEHPEKGRGRYLAQNELGQWKIRSPWYDNECSISSPKEVAIEIDMDHVGSGDTFFEGMVIEQHRTLFARPPKRTMGLSIKADVPESAIAGAVATRDMAVLSRHPNGKFKVWCALDKGRPDQRKNYVVACDISKGQGASNSTISVMCVETREKIASFADATIPPYEFAKMVMAVCLWAGGPSHPLLIWENNGDPGMDFGRQIVKNYCYPNVYFHRVAGTVSEKRGKRYGWRSDRESKASALGQLRRAYAHGGFINHDADALEEALMYVRFTDGSIGPAVLVEESSEARKVHGDRVIGDMLCLVALSDTPALNTKKTERPRNSIGGRMHAWKQAKRKAARKASQRFDFRTRRSA